MSFYFNAAICLITFMYHTHYDILIKWLMQNKSISNCEMSTIAYTAYVCKTQSLVYNVVKNHKRSKWVFHGKVKK